MTLTITTFEGEPAGINALSDFRVQQLLPRLQAINEKISGIRARFVHLVATDAPPTALEKARLAALLTYGEPSPTPVASSIPGPLFVVTPRFGTVSPWASKATDIARNCGFGGLSIKRIERITEFQITFKSQLLGGVLGRAALTESQTRQVAALLHDRMTESVMLGRTEAAKLFTNYKLRPCCQLTCWSVARPPLKLPTPNLVWRWRLMKLTTWSTPSPNSTAIRPMSS